MKNIVYYNTENDTIHYLDWYNELDPTIRIRIDQRVDRLKKGLYGDHKRLQKSELSELRMDFGAGYRIYYYDIGDVLVLFVAASNNKDQNKVIKQANIYFKDFIERNT